MDVLWQLNEFNDLTPRELYELLRLRSEVFVVEQNCVFLDMDRADFDCHHLMGWSGGALVAATRLVPPGHIYEEASIGRVVTSPAARGLGLGRTLMLESIRHTEALFGTGPIKIGAQCYLQRFYESLGFLPCGPVYLEDGIEHMPMKKSD